MVKKRTDVSILSTCSLEKLFILTAFLSLVSWLTGCTTECPGGQALVGDRCCVAIPYYVDNDGDGNGDPEGGAVIECIEQEAPEGRVPNQNDCNDDCPTCFPNHIERCDGLDNDCDGQADEGPMQLPDSDLQRGVCREQTKVCEQGQLVEPDYSAIAAYEANDERSCDGFDNDCDGRIDERADMPGLMEQLCYSGNLNEVGQGACQSGRQLCVFGLWSDCVGAILPEEEVCDGFDNDCDGEQDEDVEEQAPLSAFATGICEGQTMRCAGEPGWVEPMFPQDLPEDLRASYSEPEEGLCDNEDNDCDGRVDEHMDFDRDPSNCGGCGIQCETGSGEPRCFEGQCLACGENWYDLDEDPSNGCEYYCELDPRLVQNCANSPEGCKDLLDFRDNDCDGRFDEAPLMITAGNSHNCVLKNDEQGTLKCWGDNQWGQLGLGEERNRRGRHLNEMGGNLPAVQYTDPLDPDPAVLVRASRHTTCVVTQRGKVKCWGLNNHGQLGINKQCQKVGRLPGDMGASLEEVDLGEGRRAFSLAVGLGHVCALLDHGEVKCWGYNGPNSVNYSGQLGLGHQRNMGGGCAVSNCDAETDTEHCGNNPVELFSTTGDRLPTVDLGEDRYAISIVAGDYFSCALLNGGDIKCWGQNRSGQLGLGDRDGRGRMPNQMGDSLPVVDLGTINMESPDGSIQQIIAKAVSVEGYAEHTCAILTNGTLKCWGDNNYGQLGLNNQEQKGDNDGEMGNALASVTLGVGEEPVQLASGGSDFTCVLLESGAIKCWGTNHNEDDCTQVTQGILGLADGYAALTDVAPPECEAPDCNCGDDACDHPTCADRDCYCPDLRPGETINLSDLYSPAPSDAIDVGTGWKAESVVTGSSHGCAVLTNGKLEDQAEFKRIVKCWGNNSWIGILGVGADEDLGDDPGEMGNLLPLVPFEACGGHEACPKGFECRDNLCQFVPLCGDGNLNGDETHEDCGGNCFPCLSGNRCEDPEDCLSGVCNANSCE